MAFIACTEWFSLPLSGREWRRVVFIALYRVVFIACTEKLPFSCSSLLTSSTIHTCAGDLSTKTGIPSVCQADANRARLMKGGTLRVRDHVGNSTNGLASWAQAAHVCTCIGTPMLSIVLRQGSPMVCLVNSSRVGQNYIYTVYIRIYFRRGGQLSKCPEM